MLFRSSPRKPSKAAAASASAVEVQEIDDDSDDDEEEQPSYDFASEAQADKVDKSKWRVPAELQQDLFAELVEMRNQVWALAARNAVTLPPRVVFR